MSFEKVLCGYLDIGASLAQASAWAGNFRHKQTLGAVSTKRCPSLREMAWLKRIRIAIVHLLLFFCLQNWAS
jgi:hypothetical protein